MSDDDAPALPTEQLATMSSTAGGTSNAVAEVPSRLDELPGARPALRHLPRRWPFGAGGRPVNANGSGAWVPVTSQGYCGTGSSLIVLKEQLIASDTHPIGCL